MRSLVIGSSQVHAKVKEDHLSEFHFGDSANGDEWMNGWMDGCVLSFVFICNKCFCQGCIDTIMSCLFLHKMHSTSSPFSFTHGMKAAWATPSLAHSSGPRM
jgi:hypothetical protein